MRTLVISTRQRLPDPQRCVRRLRMGKKDALGQIRNVFGDALLYVASEILPKGTDPYQLAEIVVQAFQALWVLRANMESPGAIRLFLHKTVLDSCRSVNPGLDENDALLKVAFSEMARSMIETERTLPKSLQRFYRLKFVQRKPDSEILAESGMTMEELARHTASVRDIIRGMPKWS